MSENSLEHRLAALVASFPCAQIAVLPALWCAAKEGEVTDFTLAVVARFCQVEEGSLRLLLEAYPTLRGTGQTAAVCEGMSCYLRGAGQVLARPEDYGLQAGGFERVSCLGYCFAAPVLREAGGAIRHLEIRLDTPGVEA